MLPSVLLHEHLDGGLRVETILELADEVGYRGLPTEDPSDLTAWFDQGTAGSLERYLEAFTHTVAVMQTPAAVERVAYESGADLAADGVIYAESRFAPSLLTRDGMSRTDALAAALAGFARAEHDTGITLRLIVDAMRNFDDSLETAIETIEMRHPGIVGFDLAGPERGYPPDHHLAACRAIREANLALTIHAGEADGPHSIWSAIQRCGAMRIGHGITIIEDCTVADDAAGPQITQLGPVAAFVRDHQIHLEIAPTSNLHTTDITAEAHPIGLLHRAGFNVGVNTDNRLMSRTSMSAEFALLEHDQGFTDADRLALTRNAVGAAFCDHDTKQKLLERIERAFHAVPAV